MVGKVCESLECLVTLYVAVRVCVCVGGGGGEGGEGGGRGRGGGGEGRGREVGYGGRGEGGGGGWRDGETTIKIKSGVLVITNLAVCSKKDRNTDSTWT